MSTKKEGLKFLTSTTTEQPSSLTPYKMPVVSVLGSSVAAFTTRSSYTSSATRSASKLVAFTSNGVASRTSACSNWNLSVSVGVHGGRYMVLYVSQ